jgi:hypothetical protein
MRTRFGLDFIDDFSPVFAYFPERMTVLLECEWTTLLGIHKTTIHLEIAVHCHPANRHWSDPHGEICPRAFA